MSTAARSPRTERGFTLPEVLVALVILSVGLTGLALLALEGIAASRFAGFNTRALGLAMDFAERVRANPAGGAAYAGSGPGARSGCVNGTAPCLPAAVAAEDWYDWSAELQQALPAGAGAEVTVMPTATGVSDVRIELRWPERARVQPASQVLRFRLAP